jgi:hypothetical protein
MRKQLLSVFLPMLVLAASSAQTPASQPAVQRNELQRVNVVRGTDEIRIEMSARGTMAPRLTTADSPARLVVELPGTTMATGQSRITVGSAGVKGVRIGMDGQHPPTTRVVVDLEHACRYELNPSADGKLVLTLHTQPETAAVKPPVETKAAAVAPVAAQNSNNEVAKATSSDFVFVEPTYQPTKAVVEPVVDPAGRSQEAAAKFSDKTAVELLPVSMNAAQAQNNTSSTTITPAVNLAAEQKALAGQQPLSVGPKYTGEI